MAPAPGTKHGPRGVLVPPRAGGMGGPFRVRDARLDREGVIKALPEAVSNKRPAHARFESATEAAVALSQAGLLVRNDPGETDAVRYGVQEVPVREAFTPGNQARLARSALGWAALALACGCAWSCRRPVVSREPLRIAHEVELVSLDPIKAVDPIAKSILSNVYDALVDTDQEMRLVPALSVGWSNPSEVSWILQLRPGVRAHDGSVLTAADIAFNLERAATDPASALRDRLSTIAKVDVVDESTIRITTRDRDPLLLYRISDVFIAPRGAVRDLARRPVGTGPYRVVARRGDALDLERFEGHWRGRPRVPTIRFFAVKGGDAAVRALGEGAVDVLRWVPESHRDRISALPGIRVVSRRGLRVAYLWMNSERRSRPENPLADRRVRQSVSLAIDRRSLVARMGGRGEPMTQFVPAGVLGFVPGTAPLRHDPEAARTLLREAGYGGGFDTKLTVVASARPIAEILAEMLGNIGIRTTPDLREWPVLLADWRAANLTFFLGTWSFTSGEASMFLKECISSKDPKFAANWNPGYSNPALDALIRENFATFGAPRRAQQFEALAKMMAEEMPIVPLFNRHDLYAVRKGVKWEPRLDGRLLAIEMDREEE